VVLIPFVVKDLAKVAFFLSKAYYFQMNFITKSAVQYLPACIPDQKTSIKKGSPKRKAFNNQCQYV